MSDDRSQPKGSKRRSERTPITAPRTPESGAGPTRSRDERTPVGAAPHDELAQGVLRADPSALGRAITLVESTLPRHRQQAARLLGELWPHTGSALRIGVTGLPGVGKSTLIDALGSQLTAAGRRVAVLAIDPTSALTGGSLLGDKTRMARLASDPRAYIRPSPSGTSPGGVAARTREAVLLCEAAGFDVVFVETVGVGQAEAAVHAMVDFLLLLLLPAAGDELQGLKRGVLELADLVLINKADGELRSEAMAAQRSYSQALRIARAGGANDARSPAPVHAVSALDGRQVAEIWEQIAATTEAARQHGSLLQRRENQTKKWLMRSLETRLGQLLWSEPEVRSRLEALAPQVANGSVQPDAACEQLLRLFARSLA